MSTLTLPTGPAMAAEPQPQSLLLDPKNTSAAGLLNSQDLLQGERSVEIVHNGAIYRLYATRLGKLILTK
jgi:hemin uptake protein HemP